MSDDRGNARTETAKRTDDSDIIEAAADEGLAGGGSSAGGNRQREIGSRDDLRRATDPDAPVTGVEKSARVQPATGTRSDNEGANG